jgi:predicted phosphate transport protein (TIGR00153 family)
LPGLPSFSLGGREKFILLGVERHLSVCAEEDPRARALLGEVFAHESEADLIKRELSRMIAEGAFFGGVREDILSLIGTDDSIADATKDAARLLMMGADGDLAFLTTLRDEHMRLFQGHLLGAVNSLELLIQALRVDKSTVLARVRAVEDREEAADTEKDHLLRTLFGRPRTMDPVSIIQLRDFIFASDDIADNAENASDVVIVLVAKGYV